MIVLQKMRLKLFHDHRDLAKLSKALGKVEKIPYKFNFNNDDDNLYENDVEIKFGDNPEKEEQLNTNEANTEENIEESNEENNEANTEVNNEANNEANNELNNEESNELNKEITNESNEKTGNENENEKIEKEDNEGEKVDYESERKRNETEVQNENIDESEMPNDGETENLNENENEIENSPKEFDQTYESINIFDEEEEERMKKEIHNLKEAINHEKQRIKQYESNYYNFFEAASKIQKTWRGFHFRLNNCKPKGNLVNAETSPDDGN
ncbi:hypothetical protein TRFO_16424 [Tritrichomonas foetus]|uniref:Uncharacterized protein n=1 Tax=Tritrichomonas foetus TaxID=1144522 RepID=A0A1J4KUJ7_9EUKA|nr:hypothetical protein TRFO_16424 [Tritrichomonas foetus]|eukprot:OHT13436.1 hypothetical protein TRFO_16424 [Tritrichomonas foetus]